MWYLNRAVGAYEWGGLADLHWAVPQRDYDGDGTYLFAQNLAPDETIMAALNRIAPGDWKRVA